MCAVFIMECHFKLAFALLWSIWGLTAILLICPSDYLSKIEVFLHLMSYEGLDNTKVCLINKNGHEIPQNHQICQERDLWTVSK